MPNGEWGVVRAGRANGWLWTMLCCMGLLPLNLPGRAQGHDGGLYSLQMASDWAARVEAAPTLPFRSVPVLAQPSTRGWQSGAVSSVAVDSRGVVYELQRGSEANPVLVLNGQGKVMRSWGKGDFAVPHSIRVDPRGDVWTVDAGSSTVIKYSPAGKRLMTIKVERPPDDTNPFDGTTDVGFGPNGHVFITDGYANTRVLEYDARGRRLKQWGRSGGGAGEFNLPHAIRIGAAGTVYIADRENDRIEEFDLSGRYLGQIPRLGRVYSLQLAGDDIWVSMGRLDRAPGGSDGWVVKLDRRTGKLLGHIDVHEGGAGHDLALTPAGEPVITSQKGLLWFRAEPVGR